MSYCKKYNMHPSVALCLACEECYPPGERVNGRMCGYEVPLRSVAELLENETERRLKAAENPPEGLGPFAAVKGMDVPDSLRIGVKYTGRKRLTDEQKAKLKEAVSDFAYCAVIGLDPELHDDPYLSDLLQRKVIEPFIEPLINGEI